MVRENERTILRIPRLGSTGEVVGATHHEATVHYNYRATGDRRIAQKSCASVAFRLGIAARALYQKRKAYITDKWSHVPPISGGPLQYVRTIGIRL